MPSADPFSSIRMHQQLVADRARSDAYREAVSRVVREGDVVLDAGCGSGLLSLFACQAGAARVWAVERSEIIAVARELAQANGFGDRIRFVAADLLELELPEPVDVVVSELVSKAVFGQALTATLGRCRRFLAPGGRIVPARIELVAAPVECALAREELDFPPHERYDLDFSAARRRSVNAPLSRRFDAAELLGPGRTALALAFDSRETGTDAAADGIELEPARDGILHGFALWFVATLAPGVRLSSAPPGIPSWDQAFLPLEEPVKIVRKDLIRLRLQVVEPLSGGALWHWDTDVLGSADGSPRVSFRQSTFASSPLPLAKLRLARPDSRPRLSPQAEVERTVLDLCDGRTSLAELGRRLRAAHPRLVTSQRDALDIARSILLDSGRVSPGDDDLDPGSS